MALEAEERHQGIEDTQLISGNPRGAPDLRVPPPAERSDEIETEQRFDPKPRGLRRGTKSPSGVPALMLELPVERAEERLQGRHEHDDPAAAGDHPAHR